MSIASRFLAYLLEELIGGEIERSKEAVLLGSEVGIEGVAGDLGTLDDIGDGHRGIATLGDDLGEPPEDAFALVLCDEVLGELVSPGRHS